jgi:pimeloyl-ACP methyl ester carboxylesterase
MSALPAEPVLAAPLTLPDAAPVDLSAPWGGYSKVANLGGPVHWVDFGGPADGPRLLFVHGLGGSHVNWVQLATNLRDTYRIAVIDLPGFGLTQSAGRDTGVRSQAGIVTRFMREVLREPVVLVGNSMGGMISVLVAGAEPERVRAVALIDPALPLPRRRPDPQVAVSFGLYAIPVVGERFLERMRGRWNDRQLVTGTVKLCFADPSRSDPAVFDASVTLTAYRRSLSGLDRDFVRAARSVLAMLRRPGRYAELLHALRPPVLLVHGEDDRLVHIDAARRVARTNPEWQTLFLPGVGHTPQLEVPDQVLETLTPWLAQVTSPDLPNASA